MPLPFSFSTQRQASEAEKPSGGVETAVSERVMNLAPGHVITEPLLGTPGNTFSPPVLEVSSRSSVDPPLVMSPSPPPAASPNLRLTGGRDSAAVDAMMATQFVPKPTPTSPQMGTSAVQDWSAQIDQLRNDIFGIAMSVSALSDRMDHLEQRVPQAGQSVQAGLAVLRGEIETWLENHLNSAVEHCMHQIIISRTNAPAN